LRTLSLACDSGAGRSRFTAPELQVVARVAREQPESHGSACDHLSAEELDRMLKAVAVRKE